MPGRRVCFVLLHPVCFILCSTYGSCTNDTASHSFQRLSEFLTSPHVTQSNPYCCTGYTARDHPDFCKTSSSSFPRSLFSLMLSSLPSECPLPSKESLRLLRYHQSTNSPKPDPRSSTNRSTIASSSMLRHTPVEHFL